MQKNSYIKIQLLLSQFIAVFIWFLISVVQWSNNPKSSPGITIPLIVRGVEALCVFIVSGILILIIDWARCFFKDYLMRIILLILIYPFAIATNVLSLLIRRSIGYAPPPIDNYFFIQSLHFYIPLLLVLIVYFIVKGRILLQAEKENKLKAEGLAQQAKWMMLRYQVNPHFLFNALNSIRALIGLNDEKARRIVTEMAEYFRYSLSIEKKPLVPVKEEINAVENYIEIQKIRFPGRLRVIKKVDPEAMDCIIPVFTIQTLIENAIKYGLKTSEGIVRISIKIFSEDEKLIIQISNTGKLVNPEAKKIREEGTNTGIENLKKRLKFLDKNFNFRLYEEHNSVIASVSLNNCQKYENLESYYS